jgi:predicted ferric reductase
MAAVLHVLAHLLNYASKAALVYEVYGVSVWVTGSALMVVLLLIFSSTHLNVKRGHFEIFWVCHMLFPVFLALNVFHGKGWFGPNYWKYLLLPGTIFALERAYRRFSSRSPGALLSVTHMTSTVLSLALEKTGPLAEYKEGQYAYLLCPAISSFQWHPFTISSAPQEKTVSFHLGGDLGG